jgi:hypothetical protein
MGEKKLKLEVGKFYRTRDGRKVGPMRLEDPDDPGFPFRGREEASIDFWYARDGRTARSAVSTDTGGDIVAERTEDAARRGLDTDEEVVARFNELVLAGRVQFSESRDGKGRWIDQDAYQRLKPRPAFEPFYVNNGLWKVSLSDGGKVLSIGCKQYEARSAMHALRRVCRDEDREATANYAKPYHCLALVGKRTGVHTADGALSWSDADRILAALEAYFGKEKP